LSKLKLPKRTLRLSKGMLRRLRLSIAYNITIQPLARSAGEGAGE
jgi:hypothetical protein